jgi:hypothetical protein
VRQSSSLAPSFVATVDLVMGPLCGLANGVGRGVYRTFTFMRLLRMATTVIQFQRAKRPMDGPVRFRKHDGGVVAC